MRDLLLATHLEASLGVTAFACALALAAGRGLATVWVGAAVLAGQFSIGWANDWIDRHRDRAARRTDKPIVTGAVRADTVRRASVAALGACVGLSLLSGAAAAVAHLLAVGAGWAYDLRLKSTVASVVPFAVAFALLPVFVWLGLEGAPLPPWWVVVAGGLLGAGAHFTNTLPDLEADAATGVVGLPQRLGAAGSLAVATGLLGAGVAVVAAGAPAPGPAALAALALAAVLVVAVPVSWWRGRRRLAFRLTIAATAALVVAVVTG